MKNTTTIYATLEPEATMEEYLTLEPEADLYASASYMLRHIAEKSGYLSGRKKVSVSVYNGSEKLYAEALQAEGEKLKAEAEAHMKLKAKAEAEALKLKDQAEGLHTCFSTIAKAEGLKAEKAKALAGKALSIAKASEPEAEEKEKKAFIGYRAVSACLSRKGMSPEDREAEVLELASEAFIRLKGLKLKEGKAEAEKLKDQAEALRNKATALFDKGLKLKHKGEKLKDQAEGEKLKAEAKKLFSSFCHLITLSDKVDKKAEKIEKAEAKALATPFKLSLYQVCLKAIESRATSFYHCKSLKGFTSLEAEAEAFGEKLHTTYNTETEALKKAEAEALLKSVSPEKAFALVMKAEGYSEAEAVTATGLSLSTIKHLPKATKTQYLQDQAIRAKVLRLYAKALKAKKLKAEKLQASAKAFRPSATIASVYASAFRASVAHYAKASDPSIEKLQALHLQAERKAYRRKTKPISAEALKKAEAEALRAEALQERQKAGKALQAVKAEALKAEALKLQMFGLRHRTLQLMAYNLKHSK